MKTIKEINDTIKLSLLNARTSRKAFLKAQNDLIKAISDNLAFAVFHASNSEDAAKNLGAVKTAGVAIVDIFGINSLEHKCLNKIVLKSVHGVITSEDSNLFEFKEKGAAALKKRNLKKGYEELSLIDLINEERAKLASAPKAPKADKVAPAITSATIDKLKKSFEVSDRADLYKLVAELQNYLQETSAKAEAEAEAKAQEQAEQAEAV